MREVGRILCHKLYSLWDHEIFHYEEHAASSFAKGSKCSVVLYWNNDPEKLSPVNFVTRSSEERTEPNYDAIYCSLHWRTPSPERVMCRVAWLQDSSERTVPRIFSSFSRCWVSNTKGFNNWTCGRLTSQRIHHFGGPNAVA